MVSRTRGRWRRGGGLSEPLLDHVPHPKDPEQRTFGALYPNLSVAHCKVQLLNSGKICSILFVVLVTILSTPGKSPQVCPFFVAPRCRGAPSSKARAPKKFMGGWGKGALGGGGADHHKR